ncbi:amino acid/polyamine transporter I [Schizothecium vesticola]|uniref:Amino acid/polyamine transporter I n=1 Tax=Schizothecium vesticola TaxID=314040 RepID=A0AA40FAU7_9PEZI|nr:amino acid/polyamine transporter I [Schizothecium vesticola]
MGHQALDQAKANAANNPDTHLINRGLDDDDLHGPFTVISLIANRTIASGIFTQPYNVVTGVGNPGASLVIWFVAGVIIHCITACWVELGLSVPRYRLFNGVDSISTPRSGGDKNYLEYIFNRPDFLMTCVFGITFIIFGNLAGNAIQLGVFMQSVVDPSCQDDCVQSGPVVGWAIGALTLCALFNVATRKLSIYLNNTFAVLKVSLVLIMIFVGLGYGSTHGDGCRQIVWENRGGARGAGDIVQALFYAMYPYTGYEQPFYVLAEVERPKTYFSKSVMYTMGAFIALYMLINTSYLCMNPYLGPTQDFTNNAAILFFYRLSSNSTKVNQEAVVQGVSFLLVLFIFGNLLAQTYTASRVKQEIAKEGILPHWMWFAESRDTLHARWSRRNQANANVDANADINANANANAARASAEQAPYAATLLHWVFEVFLVLVVGLSLPPNKAYNFLTYIYTFVIVGILGFLTVCGLLYLKIDAWWYPEPRALRPPPTTTQRRIGRGWNNKREWWPWLDPLPCVIAVLALGFLLFGAFAKPSNETSHDGLEWWVKPLVGWCCLLAGGAWWAGLEVWQWNGDFRLMIERFPFVNDAHHQGLGGDDDPVQLAEMIVITKKFASTTQPPLV